MLKTEGAPVTAGTPTSEGTPTPGAEGMFTTAGPQQQQKRTPTAYRNT
jgi:hypothetical protein